MSRGGGHELFNINKVREIVADTYLSYTADIDGTEAYNCFVSMAEPRDDIRRDPRFSAFSDEELIDEMTLLEQDILVLFNEFSF